MKIALLAVKGVLAVFYVLAFFLGVPLLWFGCGALLLWLAHGGAWVMVFVVPFCCVTFAGALAFVEGEPGKAVSDWLLS